MTVALVVLGFVAVFVLLYILYRGKRPTAAAGRLSDRGSALHSGEEAGPRPFDRVRPDREERSVILEAYPALGEIPYVPVQEGLCPVPYCFVDDAIKETLRRKVSGLPTVSTVSLNLLRLLQDPQSNSGEVTTLVSTNPAFSAKVLRTVNSAYFGQAEKVTAIGRAITLLGYNNVRSLLVEDMVNNTVPAVRGDDRQRHVRLWSHSAVVSACAGHLGRSLFGLPEYALGTMGLLHDIGRYLFPLLEKRGEPVPDLPALIREDRQYHINHAAIGAFIARKWQLPDAVADTIEHHHAPCFSQPETIPESVVQQAFVVCLADLISKTLGYSGEDEQVLPVREEYYRKFNLSGNIVDLITPALIRDMEKARQTVESYAGAA
ncbi:MAG: HDOD domain-containing protein [Syntrophorhabdus sp.]|nr:HDOD domain-containing protein [Syntrophorhabdus sp.]